MPRMGKGVTIPLGKPPRSVLSGGGQGGHPVDDHRSLKSPEPRIQGMQPSGGLADNSCGPVTNTGNGNGSSNVS